MPLKPEQLAGMAIKDMLGMAMKPEQVAGFSSPTTCSASETESTIDFSSEDASLDRSGSETDLNADSKSLSACATPVAISSTPPPGLDACLCPWFWNFTGDSMMQKCGHCKALSNIKKDAQNFHDDAYAKAPRPSEKEPIRALCLAGLL